MSHDQAYRTLAIRLLSDYRLSAEERADEVTRLAQQIQQTVEIELENLEHRRLA